MLPAAPLDTYVPPLACWGWPINPDVCHRSLKTHKLFSGTSLKHEQGFWAGSNTHTLKARVMAPDRNVSQGRQQHAGPERQF